MNEEAEVHWCLDDIILQDVINRMWERGYNLHSWNECKDKEGFWAVFTRDARRAVAKEEYIININDMTDSNATPLSDAIVKALSKINGRRK